MLRKILVTLPQSFARLDFITVLKNSLIWPKTNTFCIKMIFLPKRNNAIKIWHFSKTENTSLRKLNISTRNEHFWKEWPFAKKKWKYPSILVFLQDFRFYQWTTHKVTQNLLSFYSKLTTKLLQKPIVIFPKTDNQIDTFSQKLLDFSKEFMPHEM